MFFSRRYYKLYNFYALWADANSFFVKIVWTEVEGKTREIEQEKTQSLAKLDHLQNDKILCCLTERSILARW